MKVLLIWTKDKDKVVTKHAETVKDLKKSRYKGRKPDRIIVHPNDQEYLKKYKVKDFVSKDGIIITTSGIPIYDGRVRAVR